MLAGARGEQDGLRELVPELDGQQVQDELRELGLDGPLVRDAQPAWARALEQRVPDVQAAPEPGVPEEPAGRA